jgi:hypothetical protein
MSKQLSQYHTQLHDLSKKLVEHIVNGSGGQEFADLLELVSGQLQFIDDALLPHNPISNDLLIRQIPRIKEALTIGESLFKESSRSFPMGKIK